MLGSRVIRVLSVFIQIISFASSLHRLHTVRLRSTLQCFTFCAACLLHALCFLSSFCSPEFFVLVSAHLQATSFVMNSYNPTPRASVLCGKIYQRSRITLKSLFSPLIINISIGHGWPSQTLRLKSHLPLVCFILFKGKQHHASPLTLSFRDDHTTCTGIPQT